MPGSRSWVKIETPRFAFLVTRMAASRISSFVDNTHRCPSFLPSSAVSGGNGPESAPYGNSATDMIMHFSSRGTYECAQYLLRRTNRRQSQIPGVRKTPWHAFERAATRSRAGSPVPSLLPPSAGSFQSPIPPGSDDCQATYLTDGLQPDGANYVTFFVDSEKMKAFRIGGSACSEIRGSSLRTRSLSLFIDASPHFPRPGELPGRCKYPELIRAGAFCRRQAGPAYE